MTDPEVESLRAEVRALRTEVKMMKDLVRAMYQMIEDGESDYAFEESLGGAEVGRYNN